MLIILLGPPGAGKGTQAKNLCQALGLAHVASGDLFREHRERGTALGLLAQSYMNRGELVPDEVTIRMVLERLAAPDCCKGFLLDGFPRTLEQAQALEKALENPIDRVLYIRVSEEELVRRLSGRLICRSCQTPYHREDSPPRVQGRCDRCGGELYQREDDRPESVRRRYQVYRKQTAPLVDYYRNKGILVEVEGEGSVPEVRQALLQALGLQGRHEGR